MVKEAGRGRGRERESSVRNEENSSGNGWHFPHIRSHVLVPGKVQPHSYIQTARSIQALRLQPTHQRVLIVVPLTHSFSLSLSLSLSLENKPVESFYPSRSVLSNR